MCVQQTGRCGQGDRESQTYDIETERTNALTHTEFGNLIEVECGDYATVQLGNENYCNHND